MQRNESSMNNSTLDHQTLDDIIQRIVAVAQPDKIILFGSAARGEMGPHSDVDLLVVKDTEDLRGPRSSYIPPSAWHPSRRRRHHRRAGQPGAL